jgi:hypothetical protein
MTNARPLAHDFWGVDIVNNKKYKLVLNKGKVILLAFVHMT